MLDQLTKVVSIATIVALYLTALFNVGYFSLIGYHFIGVIDISNIVYTFGLVFLFIIVFALLGTIIALGLGVFADVPPKLKSAARPVGAVALLALLFYALFGLKENEFLVFGSLFAPIAGVVLAGVAYSQTIIGRIFEAVAAAASSFLMISVGVLIVGVIIARQQMNSLIPRYDILTKSAEFLNAKIMRSSSSGFIFYHGGLMMFVPSSEIKVISASVDPIK